MPRTINVFHLAFIALVLTLSIRPVWADPPVLYSAPAYESPVRGDPDDLLLISGIGLAANDTVVYRQLSDTTIPVPHPSRPPISSGPVVGVADLVSAANAPYSLTVHLPAAMNKDRAYGLWVMTPDRQWSNELRINDARPLWITPDSAYQSASLANLPRVLKVVGRNLQPDPVGVIGATQVLLTGVNTGTVYTLTANNSDNDPNITTALQRYVAAVTLPSGMTVDHYTVQVSRDGLSWIPLLGDGQTPAQTFVVNPDPQPAKTFNVSDYVDPLTNAACPPDGKTDATGCIIAAIRDAQENGGGTVVFGPGTWLLSNTGSWNGQPYSNRTGWAPATCPKDTETCGVSYFGIILPPGVSIQGAGATGPNATKIERATTWPIAMPLFCAMGNNTITGFDFTDDNNYLSNYANNQYSGAPVIQLGVVWYFAWMWSFNDPLATSNVIISENLFDKPYSAINNGLPGDHIYITYNTFGGAYTTAIGIGQDENNVRNLGPNPTPFYRYSGFYWRDTVVSHNTFYPSSFAQPNAAAYQAQLGGTGTIATGLNTGTRADFSDNIADGTSTQYLYNPSTDPKGWRAAFFWSVGASQEMNLVSNNTITCSGDKYGDGESIVYDGSGTLGGIPAAEPVISSTSWSDPNGIAGTTVNVQGSIATQLPTSAGIIDISANPTAYYQGGFWLEIVHGVGQGQWRRVESVSLGSNSAGPTVTLNVTPAFDVPPDASSEVILDRVYWQSAIVNNYIDQRTPLCTKANARDAGGVLMLWATTGDSAVEGNQQYDASVLGLNHTYQPQQPGTTPVGHGAYVVQSHNEIRNNLISGDYDWSTKGYAGGIQMGFGATSEWCNNGTCTNAPIPPDTGFGVSIAGNTVSRASARDATGNVHPPLGAIAIGGGWESGPLDVLGLAMWQLDTDTLIFHNTLQDISDTVPGSAGGLPLVGLGIDIANGTTPTPALNWRSSFYANSCSNVDTFMKDYGLSTVRYCPSGSSGSCECRGVASLDVGVTATGNTSAVTAGGSVIYTAVVTNNDAATTAVNVVLSLEPSAGVQIAGASFTSSQGSCDSSVNVCLLGSLAAGQSATVTVTGTLPISGAWPVTFSVSHFEADSIPKNNSVMVTESAL
jgi:hypothetical protein